MKVALLSGGRSSEHEVSLESGKAVKKGLEEAGHTVFDIKINKQGVWKHQGKNVELHPGKGLLGAAVAFPVLHGPYGEDGTIQGLLEHLDIPYVGSGVMASAICMDKATFKEQMKLAKVPQVDYVTLRKGWEKHREAYENRFLHLGYPMFVKPSRLGSSVGITKVHNAEELAPAIKAAFKHDSVVLVERGSDSKEVEVSVLGFDKLTVSEPGEITYQNEWYDYQAKYTPGGMELKVPADISDYTKRNIKEIAEQAFRAVGCSGLARVDFFVEGQTALLSEINTIPGFTKTSVYTKLLEASGLSYTEVLNRLLEDAIKDHKSARSVKA